MAPANPQNLHSQESKTAMKKKAKAALAAEERNASPAPGASPRQGTSVAGNDSSESPYIRELKKSVAHSLVYDSPSSEWLTELVRNIRNTSKKISNASKTQSVILENKDKSIQQLLAAKIINADQKRQVDNKPALETELTRTEEQLSQVLKLDEEWRAKVASARTDTEKALTDKYDQEKADAIAEVKSKAEADVKQALQDGFLVLSQFLRLAANNRLEAEDSQEDANRAIEGILLSVYTGDQAAVAAMSKLYHGSDDTTSAVDGTPLQTTYAQVREKAIAAAQAAQPSDEADLAQATPADEAVDVASDNDAPVTSNHLVQTDPTVAYAGLTEIDAGDDGPMTNGHTHETPAEMEALIPNADVGDNAANAAGERLWDNSNDSVAGSLEWVEVSKPVEVPQTDTEAAPVAAPTSTAASGNPSWADEQPEPAATRASTDANDGFQSVQGRNRGRGNDGYRGGRGYRGGAGGNGPRGDRGRGRGRGGARGGPRNGGGGKANE